MRMSAAKMISESTSREAASAPDEALETAT
jgi:hypothetical protein